MAVSDKISVSKTRNAPFDGSVLLIKIFVV